MPLSDEIVRNFIGGVIGFVKGPGYEISVEELVECLLKKGLIVDREPFVFEPESLSANGLDSINIQCAGSPLCAKIKQQSAHSHIVNHGKDSNTISQSIKNSPKLTTLENNQIIQQTPQQWKKITKLKSQLLNQIQ